MLIRIIRFLGWCIVIASYYMATRSLAEVMFVPSYENLIRLVFWTIMAVGVLGLLFVRRRVDTDSWRLPVVIVVALLVAVLNLVVVLALNVASSNTAEDVPFTIEEQPAEPAQDLPLPVREISAEEVVVAVNQERVTAGLEPLTVNPLLSMSACLKTDDMIEKNYWGHYSPEGRDPWYWIKLVGYPYMTAGENLAYGFASSEAMVSGWMNSPTHRDNILNAKYKETGVCVKRADRFQGYMDQFLSVQHFGAR